MTSINPLSAASWAAARWNVALLRHHRTSASGRPQSRTGDLRFHTSSCRPAVSLQLIDQIDELRESRRVEDPVLRHTEEPRRRRWRRPQPQEDLLLLLNDDFFLEHVEPH